MGNIKFFILVALTFFLCSPTVAQDIRDMNDTPQRADTDKSKANLGVAIVSLFRDYISPVDSDRCPSYPTCSSYSIEAFKKHGFIIGWLMTVDRLIHEGKEETKVSPIVYVNGEKKIYDPVENNDFWWFKDSEAHRTQGVASEAKPIENAQKPPGFALRATLRSPFTIHPRAPARGIPAKASEKEKSNEERQE